MVSDKVKITVAIILSTAFLSYSIFLYAANPSKQYAVSEEAIFGKQIWQQQNCVACHQVYGLGGYLGPDLTNNYRLRGPEYIKAFITYGTPAMPAFHLTEKEKNALLTYLKSLDASGIADPKSFRIQLNGTIEQ